MLTLLLLACAGDKADDTLLHIDAVDGDPRVTAHPMYPWPSDYWLVEDDATLTGRSLQLDDAFMPEDFPASLMNGNDGFTRAPAILAVLDGGLDPATLPDVATTATADSPVLLLRASDWSPTPALVELDANTDNPTEQALIIRPQVTLDPSEAYVVLLTDGLATQDGDTHTPNEAFRALRDGVETDNDAVEAMREDAALVNEAIDALGLADESVVLGWSFHTRSEAQVVDPLLAMHDAAMAADLGVWTQLEDTQDGDNRFIKGSFTAPDFLGDGDVISIGGDGAPVQVGEREVEFVMTIPDTVDGPRPLILFGHGFFSDSEEITWSSLQHSLVPWGFSAAATDFMGFTEDDLIETLGAVSGDLSGLQTIIDKQRQSHIHFTLLARLAREQLAAELPIDAERVRYLGISNGGTQGAVILAASPALDHGALVVPGGGWAHMMQRAVQWTTMGAAFAAKYDDPPELQLLFSLIQQVFDPVDALNYARGLHLDPFEGRAANAVTMHMAVGDAQVSNMVTGWVARSAGIPMITPSTWTDYDLETITAPEPGSADIGAALYIYDEGYPPLPEGNVAPTEDNGAHESIRYLEAYTAQVGAFLEDGTIVQVCDGACDPD